MISRNGKPSIDSRDNWVALYAALLQEMVDTSELVESEQYSDLPELDQRLIAEQMCAMDALHDTMIERTQTAHWQRE